MKSYKKWLAMGLAAVISVSGTPVASFAAEESIAQDNEVIAFEDAESIDETDAPDQEIFDPGDESTESVDMIIEEKSDDEADSEEEPVFDSIDPLNSSYTMVSKPRVAKDGTAVWDCIWFGNYWQNTDSNGDGKVTQEDSKDPIKWRILDIDAAGNALLLSDKLIDAEQYNTINTNITWERSTLRSYLNALDPSANQSGVDYSSNGFLTNAFSEAERAAIITSNVVNKKQVDMYNVDSGNDTLDKVFCLSLTDESMKSEYGLGFSGANQTLVGRIAYITRFASNKGSFSVGNADEAGKWWTRSQGFQNNSAGYIDEAGYSWAYDTGWFAKFYGYVNDRHVCVRPAIRVNLPESIALWSYAGTVKTDSSANENNVPNVTDDIEGESSGIKLETDESDLNVNMIPGEVRRLSVSKTARYIYGVKWEITEMNPKGCVALSNGIITAKNAGSAKVKATYGDSKLVFDVNVDGTMPQNTTMSVSGKNVKITAPKTLNITMGAPKKSSVSISIPAQLRDESRQIKYEIQKDGICTVGEPVYNNPDRTKATKATFEITPTEAGATYIIWYIEEGSEKTQAATKVIVKKPITELTVSDSNLELSVGQGKRIEVCGTPKNTDGKAISFSAKGKGVKVSPSGYVIATMPGENATVTIKYGKIQTTVNVTVKSHSGNYLSIGNPVITVAAPKAGAKPKTVVIKTTTSQKMNQPELSWSIYDTSAWIGIADGKISIDSSTPEGCYLLTATPVDGSLGLNAVSCELIVK